jgi:hypothetical protein
VVLRVVLRVVWCCAETARRGAARGVPGAVLRARKRRDVVTPRRGVVLRVVLRVVRLVRLVRLVRCVAA